MKISSPIKKLYRKQKITDKTYDDSEMRTAQKQLIVTPGDRWGVKQHHWNTGANEKKQLNPEWPGDRQDKVQSQQTKIINFISGP